MVKTQERQTFRDKQEERVFNIRLRQSNQEIDIQSKPNLVKILEQEYAVRYLEALNIEPSTKNINMILKMYPLKNCEITASWKNDTGLYADTITITTRKKKEKKIKDGGSETADQEVIDHLNLGKIPKPDIMLIEKNKLKDQQTLPPHQQQQFQQQNQNQQSNNQQGTLDSKNKLLHADDEEKKEDIQEIIQGFQLDFDPETIKKMYIYPFNQSFLRKLNIQLKDDEIYQSAMVGDPGGNSGKEKYLVYEQPQYHFPFTQVKLEPNELKDLQHPLTMEIPDIKEMLDKFQNKFPKDMIPTKKPINTEEKISGASHYIKEMKSVHIEDPKFKRQQQQFHHQNSQQHQQTQQDQIDARKEKLMGKHITFKVEEVNQVFSLLASDEMAKIIGISAHLCYWVVFGNVNPIQIDSLAKKQMYIMMHELREYFESKVGNKLWNTLGFPMLLLCLKMNVEYILKTSYPVFFEENSYVSNSCGVIAMDKIFCLLDKIFDETNFFGRFTFLESDFKTLNKQGNIGNERKFLRKRLFATSPFLDLMINNPQDSKTRTILAKKHIIELKETSGGNSKNNHVLQSLPKKRNASTLPKQQIRIDKSIYQDEFERRRVENQQKKKMVKMVMGKVLPKIDARVGKRLA